METDINTTFVKCRIVRHEYNMAAPINDHNNCSGKCFEDIRNFLVAPKGNKAVTKILDTKIVTMQPNEYIAIREKANYESLPRQSDGSLHPNILGVSHFWYDEDTNCHVFVHDLGCKVMKLPKYVKTASLEDRQSLITQVIELVQYFHTHRILHGLLLPNSMFVAVTNGKPQLKVGSFLQFAFLNQRTEVTDFSNPSKEKSTMLEDLNDAARVIAFIYHKGETSNAASETVQKKMQEMSLDIEKKKTQSVIDDIWNDLHIPIVDLPLEPETSIEIKSTKKHKQPLTLVSCENGKMILHVDVMKKVTESEEARNRRVAIIISISGYKQQKVAIVLNVYQGLSHISKSTVEDTHVRMLSSLFNSIQILNHHENLNSSDLKKFELFAKCDMAFESKTKNIEVLQNLLFLKIDRIYRSWPSYRLEVVNNDNKYQEVFLKTQIIKETFSHFEDCACIELPYPGPDVAWIEKFKSDIYHDLLDIKNMFSRTLLVEHQIANVKQKIVLSREANGENLKRYLIRLNARELPEPKSLLQFMDEKDIECEDNSFVKQITRSIVRCNIL